MFAVADCVDLNLKVPDVTPKRWGYFGQSYILRLENETNDIFYHTTIEKRSTNVSI